MTTSSAPAPVRIGVIGIGSMGRNHARLLQQIPEADFIGAVDPVGDVHGAIQSAPVYSTIDELLDQGIDAAVIAVPSDHHLPVAVQMSEAGVHVLIEKPLASVTEQAEAILDAFAPTGLIAAVGHVERFNAATFELKARVQGGMLGHIFSVTTERVGPYPLRVRDVGVIKDLASHDIDLLRFVGGEIEDMTGQLAHKLGRPFEDLVEAIGRSTGGAVLRMSVNWLTPTKRRTITVLGEGGALVADLLRSDLTHYANADVPMEWDQMQRLRGVSEGDMTRFAFPKLEPLLVEVTEFCRAVQGLNGRIVTLADGLAVVRLADQLERMPSSSPTAAV